MASAEGVAVFPAFAADMAPAPVYTKEPVAPPLPSWSGFYLGSGVGFRSANVSEQTLSATEDGVSLLDSPFCSFEPCGTTSSLGHTSFRFSPYFGYNWQFAQQWLAGVEGDAGFGSKTSTIDGVPLPGAGVFSSFNSVGESFAVKTSWDASLRARIGYLATPDVLIYATAGPAWQRVEATSTCGPNNFFICGGIGITGVVTDTTTKLGYTVGGGIETLMGGHWLLRAEFRYSDFGSIINTDVRTDVPFTDNVTTSYKLHLTTETALAGVAYKF